ncbi:MAG TPA: DUF1287 domain-containing protein [Pyrinomonadaceae bacterium]|nr:DUF1287 domain-containing protein [Pyrinomonadaceae bacterium]
MRLHLLRLCAYCALAALVVAASVACKRTRADAARTTGRTQSAPARVAPKPVYASPVLEQLVAAAIERPSHRVQYDGGYYQIAYPGGDVPADRGACTDEVVRAYRAVGVDLQREVHEDMEAHFAVYPQRFGLARPDPNIDHRRVPNLMTFFARKGAQLPVTTNAADYAPGDIVTWDLSGGQTHIGIVVDVPSDEDAARYQIMHNIGAGPQIQDVLFAWQITGHYRYTGPSAPPNPATKPVRAAGRNSPTGAAQD